MPTADDITIVFRRRKLLLIQCYFLADVRKFKNSMCPGEGYGID